MDKIFLYAYEVPGFGGDVMAVALAEDGEVLVREFATDDSFARAHLGLGKNPAPESYSIKYPKGYTLEWVDVNTYLDNQDFLEALKANEASVIYSKAPFWDAG